MAIAVVLKCSECATVRDAYLRPGDKEITCPACARRMQNLTAEELAEMQAVQRKQGLLCAVSVALFAVAVACLVLSMGDPGKWAPGKMAAEAGAGQSAGSGLLIGAVICGLASLVVGFLGSMKRFVVEF